MNNDQHAFLTRYISKNQFVKKLGLIVCFAICILVPLIFIIYTVKETNAFGKDLLGTERYNERMKDNYLYAAIMFVALLAVITPFAYLLHRFFNRYLIILNSLNGKDIDRVRKITKNLGVLERYSPSCIFKENTVTFFTLFKAHTFSFFDINRIKVTRVSYKGVSYIIAIETVSGKLNYRFNDLMMTRSLVDEAYSANSKIDINNRNSWDF
ncbi:hypothetical protein [Pedobacter agri]|uniref:hypothetical protein n=1 Tax=Pedobacter agri TaxID=454586 RepID=UPI002931B033|nr:hypothetical protein [Pedobacter agri]